MALTNVNTQKPLTDPSAWHPPSDDYAQQAGPTADQLAQTLDEHVLIGGRYFDVLAGSYHITPLKGDRSLVTLSCTYRVTTTLNFYCAWWADFLLNDFNETILEVIKKRSES